jgi:hypothetical protein
MPSPLSFTIEALVTWTADTPRDLNGHVPYLFDLAKKCETVAEFGGRRESTIALLGCPGTVYSFNEESQDPLIDHAHYLNSRLATSKPRTLVTRGATLSRAGAVKLDNVVDLLFLDVGNAQRTLQILERCHQRVQKWIVIHDTAGSSLCSQWSDMHPEWTEERHTDMQHGLTTLRRTVTEQPPSE